MSLRIDAVSFETRHPAMAAAFWAGVLARTTVHEADAVLVPGDATQIGLRFVEASADKREPNRLHLHVTSATEQDQRRTVQTIRRSGGRRRGTGLLPFGRDIYMADPGGDEFCVIAPGNVYLQGCGPLGEVTCQGSPAAGRFWLAALGWSLVWDQDDQIAIQSPAGGTKLAWDGVPEPDSPGWNRQRFEVVADDPDFEVHRLVGLGATLLPPRSGRMRLLDPDGSEFALLAG